MSLPPKLVTIAEGERAVKAAGVELGGPVVSVIVRRDTMLFAYHVDVHGPKKCHVFTLDEWERLRK